MAVASGVPAVAGTAATVSAVARTSVVALHVDVVRASVVVPAIATVEHEGHHRDGQEERRSMHGDTSRATSRLAALDRVRVMARA